MRASVRTVSFLLLGLLVVSCGTKEEPTPRTDVTDDTDQGDSSEDSSLDTEDDTDDPPEDTREDPGHDTDVIAHECDGPNPAQSCMTTGCRSGQQCVLQEGECAPSSCTCVDEQWACTADCGPRYACEPVEVGECPDSVPAFGSACETEGLDCTFGSECCCGSCHPSTFCGCYQGTWGCGATDACFIPGCVGRSCDEESDCESFGEPASCVGDACVEVGEGAGWSPGPEIELKADCRVESTDPFVTDAVELEGNTVAITIGYSGGCTEHQFRVCWSGDLSDEDAPSAVLTLQHDSRDDPCEAWPTTTLEVSLAPVVEAYWERFDEPGKIAIEVAGERIEFEVSSP